MARRGLPPLYLPSPVGSPVISSVPKISPIDAPPSRIGDRRLYVGNAWDGNNPEVLESLNVTLVLNVSDNPTKVKSANVRYVHHPLMDVATQLLHTPIEVTADIIKDELAKDGCVLVHCTMGISRAPSIVMGYLMTAEGLSFDETKELVFSARSRAEPNFSFMTQLAQLSKISPI